MKKKILESIRWVRGQGEALSSGERVVAIVAIVLICVRIILPIRHLSDGFLFYTYPFSGGVTCVRQFYPCDIDRSRTAIESASIGLAAVGLVMMLRAKR